jgi:glycosyltransferase involved in cell wall biosynthesis
MRHGSLFLFTAISTIDMYLKRYPELDPKKCILLPNGYDEEDFRNLNIPEPRAVPADQPLQLLHAGLIYPEERDPRPFFQALSRLKREGHTDASRLQVNLRASGEEPYYAKFLHELSIEDIVHLLPPVPYQQSLAEAAASDALLLFQGVTCNHQIPAKTYEYLRLRRPILALTTHEGDTAALLRDTGGATIADMYSADTIYSALREFFRSLRQGNHSLPDPAKTSRYARRNQAHQLAGYLDKLI